MREPFVGSNVWIGYGARFLRGVRVGDNAIVGTNSVVDEGRALERGGGGAGEADPDA